MCTQLLCVTSRTRWTCNAMSAADAAPCASTTSVAAGCNCKRLATGCRRRILLPWTGLDAAVAAAAPAVPPDLSWPGVEVCCENSVKNGGTLSLPCKQQASVR